MESRSLKLEFEFGEERTPTSTGAVVSRKDCGQASMSVSTSGSLGSPVSFQSSTALPRMSSSMLSYGRLDDIDTIFSFLHSHGSARYSTDTDVPEQGNNRCTSRKRPWIPRLTQLSFVAKEAFT